MVSGVVGLSGSGGWQPHLAFPDLSAGASLTPADMETLYGSAAIANPGMGETVAILGAGNPPDPDERHRQYFMAAVQAVRHDLGAELHRSRSSAGRRASCRRRPRASYIENVLDAEMVLSMAPLATVVHVMVATNSPGLFTDGISYIVNQVPQGARRHRQLRRLRARLGAGDGGDEHAVRAGQAEGQQWFFASGDSGTDGCRDGAGNKHITAGWPTSSPYVIGVGGTMIGNGGAEITWNQNSPERRVGRRRRPVGGALQAGLSDGQDAERQRARHAGHLGHRRRRRRLHRLQEAARHRRRHRAASPVCAGAWALVDQGKGGKGITDALTKIYAVGTSGAFNDVTVGDNGGPDGLSPGYPAGPGYDLATGWGSPNVAQLIAHLP